MDPKIERAIKSWTNFLNPEMLRENLIVSSLFLTVYETMMESIVDQLKDFYLNGFDEEGFTYSSDYDEAVLSKHKSKLEASCLWWKNHKTIDDSDIQIIGEIRQHRNQVAHELMNFIAGEAEVNMDLFTKACEIIRKIDIWWIRNIEMDSNPDFDDVDKEKIPDEEIASGRMIIVGMMLNIVQGDDSIYKHICEHESAYRNQ